MTCAGGLLKFVTFGRLPTHLKRPSYKMSTAATHVTSQEGALSTPSSENGSAPESDTSLVDSESHSQDKLLLAPEVTFTPLPLESSLLSELPGSTPHPESISQLKQKVEEWTQDPDSTQLVLKSISTGTFNLLRPDLMNHTSSFPCKLIKALYISRLQQVELRKLSLLHWTASHHLVSLIFQQIGDLSWEMGDKTGQGGNWTDSLTLDVATAHVCPDGEPTDGKTADPFAYMSATCCVWPMSLYLHKGSGGIYDEVLPTIVVVAGVNTFDEEISEEAKRWLKPRNGLSTEVNGVIYISLKVERKRITFLHPTLTSHQPRSFRIQDRSAFYPFRPCLLPSLLSGSVDTRMGSHT